MFVYLYIYAFIFGLPWWLWGKESACQFRRPGFNPRVGKIPWISKWQPIPFLPGESMDREAWWVTVHRVAKELDMIER